MAAFVKFYIFVTDLGNAKHNFASNKCYVFLTNSTPDSNNHIQYNNLTDLTTANGYTAGGTDTQMTWTRANNITYMNSGVASIVWTATAGNFGPFRYICIYNNNATNGPLIGYWDYGSSINCNNGESFTWDPPANNGILSLT